MRKVDFTLRGKQYRIHASGGTEWVITNGNPDLLGKVTDLDAAIKYAYDTALLESGATTVAELQTAGAAIKTELTTAFGALTPNL